MFLQSGCEKVTAFFTELAIPLSMIQAYLVSAVELVGRALLILGLLTRLTVIPLIVIIVVVSGYYNCRQPINAYPDVLGLS
ncbi:MAG: DoxX family membrane protein [Bacteriovorax sp.]|nr:DoxX family membrane protein [Bacteriovorax sp.]